MQKKYKQILKIFHEISCTSPDDKLAAIEGKKAEMRNLQ